MEIRSAHKDGYYHPSTEDELRELVVLARDQKLPLRVRGAGHSVKEAIYTTGFDGRGAPPVGVIDVMLDRYRAVTITPDPDHPGHALVDVEAGCNLGKDPYDPTGTSTWQNSLNYQLQQRGYALDDLGGISHQTLSGFLSTGSSGGSLVHAIDDNILGIRLIDGTGAVHDLRRDDPDPAARDMFFAAGVSMGLLGVISRVRLRARPAYNLFGQQVTTSTATAAIDLFGPGTDAKPSLERFLREAPYSRLMWWPQNDFDRIQVWQAARMEPMPDFTPQPYLELGDDPQLTSLAGSLFYTLIGNLDDISKVPAKLDNWYRHLRGELQGSPDDNVCKAPRAAPARAYTVEDVLAWIQKRLERALAGKAPRRAGWDAQPGLALLEAVSRFEGAVSLPPPVATIVTRLIRLLLDGALESPLAQLLATWLDKAMPYVIDEILGAFVSDGTLTFWDTWMCGLPMDNQMDDQLWPTDFTELWIPVERTAEVMRKLQGFYAGGGVVPVAYQHTGAFSCELYAARSSQFWMSPSYGADVFRVDVFWFALNAGEPTDDFYPRFWELLREFGFRPHWGKFLPPASDAWRAYYRAQLPRLDDFLELRSRLDPDQIFVTEYWRGHLGIERPPAARGE